VARELHSEIDIDATPERVWSVLMDFDAYPAWNPFVTRIAGDKTEGAQLEVRLEPPGGRAMTFKPAVVKHEPNREFRWHGKIAVSGLFDGEHVFIVEPRDGGTRFVQRERFTGVLVPVLMPMIGNSTHRGFEAMNEALKARAEAP